jgi:hypothetical protein
MVSEVENPREIRARVHDFKTPNRPEDWRQVVVVFESDAGEMDAVMTWYGENLFRLRSPRPLPRARVCATDRAGNRSCSPERDVQGLVGPDPR